MNTTTQAPNGKEPYPETILPERAQTARKYRTITKTALATRLGVSAQATTTYETLGAPFALAHRLAEALWFPPSPTNLRHITKTNQNIGSDPKREIFL